MTEKAKVFVKGPPYKRMTEDTFNIHGGGRFEVVNSVPDSDLVVLTGGEDIHPSIYGETPLPEVYFDVNRDRSDLQVVKQAFEQGKFLVGICRGAQLLNCVPNGGTLWQDVDGHEVGTVHDVFDCVSGTWIQLNSVHHQMLRPTDKGQVLAWAQESTVRRAMRRIWRAPKPNEEWPEPDRDPEVVWYPETRCLCFQAHPEFGNPMTTRYFFELLDLLWFNKNQYELKTEAA